MHYTSSITYEYIQVFLHDFYLCDIKKVPICHVNREILVHVLLFLFYQGNSALPQRVPLMLTAHYHHTASAPPRHPTSTPTNTPAAPPPQHCHPTTLQPIGL